MGLKQFDTESKYHICSTNSSRFTTDLLDSSQLDDASDYIRVSRLFFALYPSKWSILHASAVIWSY